MTEDFESFGDLPVELQREAIREGETLLQAQLDVASDADRRALTWGGFLLTSASATIAGAFTVLGRNDIDHELANLAMGAGAALLCAAWAAIYTVKPEKFCLPGNDPMNWLPDQWDCVGTAPEKAKAARLDQARVLSGRVNENARSAERRALRMRFSMGLAFFTVFASAMCLLTYWLL